MAVTYKAPGTYVLGGISAPSRGTGQAFRAGLTTAQQRREREQAMQLRASAEQRAQEQFEMAKADRARAAAQAAEAKRKQDELNRLLLETSSIGLDRSSTITPATAPATTGFVPPSAGLSFGTTVAPTPTTTPTTPYSGRPMFPGQLPADTPTPYSGRPMFPGQLPAGTPTPAPGTYGSMDDLYDAFMAGELDFPTYSRMRFDMVRSGQAALSPEQAARQAEIDQRTFRLAEAAATGEAVREVIDRSLGPVSAAGTALYGAAADALGVVAATVGLTGMAADLEQFSDQAYNVARTNLANGLSATAGMTAADFNMEPAQFAAEMRRAEEDAANKSVIVDEAAEDDPTVDEPAADTVAPGRSPVSPVRFTYSVLSDPPQLSQKLRSSYELRSELVSAYNRFAQGGYWEQANALRERITKLDETLDFMEGQQAVNDLVVFNDHRRMDALLSNYMGMNVTVTENPAAGTFSLLVNGIPHPDPALSNMSAAALEESARSFFDVQYRTTMAQRAALQADAYAEAFGEEAGKRQAERDIAEAGNPGFTFERELAQTGPNGETVMVLKNAAGEYRLVWLERDKKGDLALRFQPMTQEDLETALLGVQ
jgi:hypothetical protein